MLLHNLATPLLEVQRPLLHLWMHLTVDEYSGVEVLLCEVAQEFVLFHDALVDGVDILEGFESGGRVAVDFVLHC